MLTVVRSSWPLLLGIMLLMVGNGMQGTLLGVRGGIEGIPTSLMALVMAGYFGGFVVGTVLGVLGAAAALSWSEGDRNSAKVRRQPAAEPKVEMKGPEEIPY